MHKKIFIKYSEIERPLKDNIHIDPRILSEAGPSFDQRQCFELRRYTDERQEADAMSTIDISDDTDSGK